MTALVGNIGTIINLNQAVYGNAMGYPAFQSQINLAGGQPSVIALYNSALASSPSSVLATSVLNNLFINVANGVPAASVAALNAALTQAFQTYPTAKGQVISNLTSILGGLETDVTFGSAAIAFNNQAAANFTYSNNPANTVDGTPSSTPVFNLTTGVDTVPNLVSGQTVNGTMIGTSGAAGTTLQVFDTFNTGAGIDTLNLITTAATALTAGNTPTLNGVEIFNLLSLSGATSLVSTLAPNLTTLNLGSYSAASAVTVTDASSLMTTFGISNSSFDVSDLTVTYAVGASAAASDTVTLNLNNVDATADTDVADDALITFLGDAAGTNNGIENFVINVTGGNALESLISLENSSGNSALKAITIAGSGSLSISTVLDFDSVGVGTINAAANTGGVAVQVGTDNITFTGGTGGDVLIFANAGDLNANDSITMGAGVDTIIVADTSVSSTTTALNSAINATGAEIVGFSAAASVDMSQITASNLLLVNDVDTTVTKLASTDTVIIEGANVANRDINLTASLGFNTANLLFIAEDSVASTSKTLNLTSQATVNIVSTSDSSSLTNLTGAVTNSANSIINISGNGNIVLGAATSDALGAAAVVNASTLTGRLTVNASANASSITGGTGNDTIGGGAGADTIIGGAGADTITTGANEAGTGETITGGLGADRVTINYAEDSSAGAYTLAYNATAAESFVTATATAITSMDTLTMDNTTNDVHTITLTTGVLSTQTGSLSVIATSNAPVIGTTSTSSAFGFIVYNSVAAVDGTSGGQWVVYQDTDGDSVIEQGEFALTIIGSTDASDTIGFAVSSGKLVTTWTGA